MHIQRTQDATISIVSAIRRNCWHWEFSDINKRRWYGHGNIVNPILNFAFHPSHPVWVRFRLAVGTPRFHLFPRDPSQIAKRQRKCISSSACLHPSCTCLPSFRCMTSAFDVIRRRGAYGLGVCPTRVCVHVWRSRTSANKDASWQIGFDKRRKQTIESLFYTRRVARTQTLLLLQTPISWALFSSVFLILTIHSRHSTGEFIFNCASVLPLRNTWTTTMMHNAYLV